LTRDDREALRLYRLAANQGNAAAHNNIGAFYVEGRGGLRKDEREALRYYKLAADQGFAVAQTNIGDFHRFGRGGLAVDEQEAARFYKLAADQGNSVAQGNLGLLYEQGLGGLPKDEVQAAQLYKIAATNGNAWAQGQLVIYYEQGRGGLTKNNQEALRFAKLAADGGNEWARNRLKALGATPSETEAANRAASAANRAARDAQMEEANRALSRWVGSWFRCHHGIRGGKTDNRCEKCVEEKAKLVEEKAKLAEEKAKLEVKQQFEFQERMRLGRIADLAKKLSVTERSRLAQSYRLSIDELRALTPWQFECEVADMFRRFGYQVEQTPPTNDYGRDAILYKGGKKYLLECKKYGEGNVSGRPDLQRFYGAINSDGAVSGFFVSTGGFSKEAVEYAAKNRIELLDQNSLLRKLSESKPVGTESDSYKSMCRQCEDVVFHRLRTPESIVCRNGHEVAPTLTFESILPPEKPMKRKRR
jgi:TPR repeat protein